MVVLTSAYVEKECARTQSVKSLTRGIEKNHVKKISHLYMNDKFISAIGDLSNCRSLRVIYLQNNCLSKIENLDFAENLIHLYLQRNELPKIENLEALRNLTKLCLGHNCISVVEGLEKLEKLCELHVEKQRLLQGESLLFDPRTLDALSTRLKVLNVTGNQLTSLRPISRIVSLEVLEARGNEIKDIEDLTESVSCMRVLRELYLQGNPVTRAYRYRENLIANSDSLSNKFRWKAYNRGLSSIHEEFQGGEAASSDSKTYQDDSERRHNEFFESATSLREIGVACDNSAASRSKVYSQREFRHSRIAAPSISCLEIHCRDRWYKIEQRIGTEALLERNGGGRKKSFDTIQCNNRRECFPSDLNVYAKEDAYKS